MYFVESSDKKSEEESKIYIFFLKISVGFSAHFPLIFDVFFSRGLSAPGPLLSGKHCLFDLPGGLGVAMPADSRCGRKF